MKIARRMALALATAGLSVVATACPPTEVPSEPIGWTSAFTGSPGDWAVTVGTTTNWHAEFRLPAGASAGSIVIQPRTGSNGDTLGPAQVISGLPVNMGVDASGPSGLLTDQILLTRVALSSPSEFQFVVNNSGTWSVGSAFTLPLGERVRAVSDTALVTSTMPPVSVKVYPVAIAGGAASLGAAQVLAPPASWPTSTMVGGQVAHEGDVIAVSGVPSAGSGTSLVGLFRNTGGTWSAEQTLSSPGEVQFGSNLAIDDRGATERLAVGVRSSGPGIAGRVETFTSSVAVWSPEATINPPSGVADSSNGTFFSATLALDGDLMVVGSAAGTYPAATAGGADRTLMVQLAFAHSGAGWAFDEALRPVPGTDADSSARDVRNVVVAGTHVATTAIVAIPPAPPANPSPSQRIEAWRFDRH